MVVIGRKAESERKLRMTPKSMLMLISKLTLMQQQKNDGTLNLAYTKNSWKIVHANVRYDRIYYVWPHVSC